MPDRPLRNDADPDWQEIHRAAERRRSEVAALFLEAFVALGSLAIVARIRDALRHGDDAAVMDAVPISDLLDLEPTLADIFGGIATDGAGVALGAPVNVTLTVDLASSAGLPVADLERWAAGHAAELVVDITEETRAALRGILTQAVQSGTSPRITAQLVESVIGLNQRQAQAVRTYWRTLVDAEMKPWQIARLTGRYADRLLRARALTIARHETLLAASMGRRAVWDRDLRNGLIDPSRWEREWVAIVPSDGRTCSICEELDGARAAIGAFYPEPGGDGPPQHVTCRCTEILRRVP